MGNVALNISLELINRGYRVKVITPLLKKRGDTNSDYIIDERLEIIRPIPMLRYGNAMLIPSLYNWIKRYREDIVIHMHYPFYLSDWLINLASRLKNPPSYILTYHLDSQGKSILDLFFKGYDYTIGSELISNASWITVSSLDYIRYSRLRHIFRRNMHKVVEVPLGVDIDRFRPDIDGSVVRERYGIEPDDKVVLFVGALDRAHWFKGVEYLIKAAGKIRRKDVKWLIVGEGELRSYYEGLSSKMGVAESIIFAGWVSNESLPLFYAASDLLVLPSINMGEAFGLVLLESMASGKPVVASYLPGVRTVIDHGKDGFLVRPRDVDGLSRTIRFIVENLDMAREMGNRARKKMVEKYSWKAVVDRLVEIYNTLI
jgi:glycosyltransferase involved in cell wall biosynthesis